jgi:1-acyl-sn-glycerol-3-phosphate acyltransferase
MRVLRVLWRVPVMIVLLFAGLAIIGGIFPLLGLRRRERIISIWSRALLGACGVRLDSTLPLGSRAGPRPDVADVTLQAVDPRPQALDPAERRSTGTLIVCNHISWLDIFVVLALKPARFVAKIEIASWPLVGLLVRGVGTLFIERGRRHAVHQLNERIEFVLNAGQCVAVFPEGTTSDGRRLLPFHANLLEPAIRSGAAVIPIGLRYLRPDGSPHEAVDFTGDTSLVGSMLRIFGASRLRVRVIELPPVRGTRRHAVAAEARTALAQALGLPTDDTIPETLQRAIQRDAARTSGGRGSS